MHGGGHGRLVMMAVHRVGRGKYGFLPHLDLRIHFYLKPSIQTVAIAKKKQCTEFRKIVCCFLSFVSQFLKQDDDFSGGMGG